MTAMLSARTNATNETRKIGNSQEVTARVLSLAAIRWKCAFTLYERSFPEEPDRRGRSNANDVRIALDTGAAFGGCHRHRAVSPDDRHLHVGRERPPAGRAWGEEGGSQMGVAHAPAVALFGCDSGADRRPAAQSAAG
jgi:hypothetical protein